MDEPTQKPKCSLGILCGKTSLFVLTFGYALLGAILFKYLEGDGEKHQVTDFRRSREDCLKELWIITGYYKKSVEWKVGLYVTSRDDNAS